MNHTVTIERMAYSPDAIAHLENGKTVFVEGAAPGDVVQIEIVEDKKSFARGKIVSLEDPSPSRIDLSSHIDWACGTASWQHLSYKAQLQAKRDNVVGALTHGAGIDAARAEGVVASCVPSKREWNYRNKIELACESDAQGKLALGFHREGTGEFISAGTTKLAHKNIEKAPKALQGAIRYAQGNRDLGIFRVGVRHSLATGELEVALWTHPGPFPRATFAKTLSTALKSTSIVRVLANPGKSRKIKGVETLDGRGYWRERMGVYEFSTQAPSFFQVNTAQANKLVALTLEQLGNLEGAYIADLYAGGGTFSIPLADAGADVVAVEAAASSVRDLRFNAELNGVEVDVVGGDSARELKSLGVLDALVVDPPRAGLADSIVSSIGEAHPETVAYISCNPSTWARDVARLEGQGYLLSAAIPVDLFPQTHHVEIASFFKQKS